eukprot:c36529_g1_i1 orf=340-2442(-)
MASLSKHSASKPKLERRLARRFSDYEASDSPRSPAFPSSFRALDKGNSKSLDKENSKSFRVTGVDSQEEIKRICEQLGLMGGADAFSIPQDAWEAGRAKSGSLDRFIENHKERSKSLDDPFFNRRGLGGRDGDLAVSSTPSLSPSQEYNSMSSSSTDSFTSDSGLMTGEKGFFRTLETPREQVLPSFGIRETQHRDDRQQARNVFQWGGSSRMRETQQLDDRKQTDNVAHDPVIGGMQHQDDHQTRVPAHSGHKPGIHWIRHQDDVQTSNDMERVSRVVEQMAVTNRQISLPPPPVHSKSYIPLLTTQELLASFAPDEDIHDDNNQLSDEDMPDEQIDDDNNQSSDQDDSSQSDSNVRQANVLKEKLGEEEFGFVSEVVQQHGATAKEQTLVEDSRTLNPSTSEHSVNDISSQAWRKLDLLGSGSFGTVYEGMSEDGVYFAVKEVSLSEKDSKAQQCVVQLEQEIEFLSKFQHENIVRYLGTQKEPDKLYIFLELVTKGSLSSLYQKYTLFDSQIRSYTRQILCGLKYLHERKVMHRDIKCANILVDVNGKIKVADFGLAKQISQLDELKSCKGSAYWMAPEVVDPRKTYSFPADIWSLGCTVLEMATRRPPFGDMEWHRALWKLGHGEAPPIPQDLTEDAKDFIKKCLEVNPARRPSASRLLEHPFVQYVGGTGLTPRNSFTEETSELPIIAEERTFDG